MCTFILNDPVLLETLLMPTLGALSFDAARITKILKGLSPANKETWGPIKF